MKKITNPSDTVLIDPNEPLILPDGTALVGRIEWFLYALCCLDYQNLPTPMSRIEEFANALITGEIPNIEPQSRAEQFFLAILDGNVSNLPQPQSRSEVLLDKLARGEFDLSDVEPIQSRYELLLAYLIKNGGIGNIDYVLYEFSETMKTMYNTVEKPFKSLELSGNTLVNCVLEDTENDDYTSFDKDYSGTSFTINGTSEGAIKSAILKGQTLVNLVGKFKNTNNIATGATCDEEYIIIPEESSAHRQHYYMKEKGELDLFKPSTTYTVRAEIVENTLTQPFVLINNYRGSKGDISAQVVEIPLGFKGVFKATFTTVDNTSWGERSRLGFLTGVSNTGSFKMKNNLVVVEGDYTNVDIPYFEGMQSVKMPVLTTTGKNLFDEVWESGSFNGTTGAEISDSNTVRSKNYISVEPNKTYTFDVNAVKVYYDREYNVISVDTTTSNAKRTITVPSNCHYIRIRMSYNDYASNNLTKQLEKGSISTSYEPFKSNILTVNEEVELRGIGDVKDTLDLTTGELTQRIGEVDLTKGWQSINYQDDDFISLYKSDKIFTIKQNAVCDKLPIETWGNLEGNKKECVWVNGPTSWGVILSKTKATNREEIIEWVSQNLEINYKLATPIVKTVDLDVVDQDGNTIPKIKSYNDVTHLEVSIPKQSLLPNVSAEVATDNSKDMSSLTIKHQEISEAQSTIEDNIQSQSDEIDTALMATTEIFESILE